MSRSSSLKIRLGLGLALFGGGAALLLGAWLHLPGPRQAGPLPPLTSAQAALSQALRADVTTLCETFKERSWAQPQNLAAAADWLAAGFTAQGLTVSRQRFEAQGGSFENVVAERTGTRGEVFVVGAHYDSVPGTVGADDNASGVAVLRALAGAVKDPGLSLRFVAFATEESHFQTPGMGSWVYARSLKARQEKVVGMLSLETLGTYTDEPGSQTYPVPGLAFLFPTTGNFVAFASNLPSRPLLSQVIGAFRAGVAFPAEGVALPAGTPGVGWSDQWAFWQEGYPAVMATDTAPFRNPRYHTTADTPNRLDYDQLARVTTGLTAAVATCAK